MRPTSTVSFRLLGAFFAAHSLLRSKARARLLPRPLSGTKVHRTFVCSRFAHAPHPSGRATRVQFASSAPQTALPCAAPCSRQICPTLGTKNKGAAVGQPLFFVCPETLLCRTGKPQGFAPHGAGRHGDSVDRRASSAFPLGGEILGAVSDRIFQRSRVDFIF